MSTDQAGSGGLSNPIKPRNLLVISVLDVERQANNREHHLISQLGARFSEVTVVYKERSQARSPGRALLDALVPRTRVFERGVVRYLAVNPLFNHAPGMARSLSQSRELTSHGGRGWRKRLFSFLNYAAILKDVCFLPSALLTTIFYLKGSYDVCVALGPWANMLAWPLKGFGRIKLIVYEDRDLETGFLAPPLRRRLVEAAETWLLRRADLVISIGERLARLRRRQSGRAVHVVPTGVDAHRFIESPRFRPPSSLTLLYTGNLEFWSGLDVILPSLKALRTDIPGIRLLIVGGAISLVEDRLHNQAREMGLTDVVTFFGARPNVEIAEIARDADVGLAFFPPVEVRRFSVPLKVFEYMAAGLAVIGTRNSETSRILRRSDCGIAVTYSESSFIAAVRELFDDPARMKRMGENGRRASAEFDWQRLMDREYGLICESWRQTASLAPHAHCD